MGDHRHDPPQIVKFGGRGSDKGKFDRPHGLTVSKDGLVFVSDYGNERIQSFNLQGTFLHQFPTVEMERPQYININKGGHIFVTHFMNSCVYVYREDGHLLSVFGGEGSGEGELKYPGGICTNTSGNIIVADKGNKNVVVYDKTGNFLRYKFGRFGSGDGQLDSPYGICLDMKGNVIVVDRGNWRVSVFDSEGKFVRHIMTDMPDLCAVAAGPNFLVVTCVGHCGTDTATIIPYSP
uniref:Uncharacterized protein n=1 Tax=Branchiostoma floridae TaxID=7739 RepID=C3Z9J5_BRAFL|eukprot:XP_002594680.1 hypothetical protein BRAFLDRAFT_246644 [Branchiostoma floridae]